METLLNDVRYCLRTFARNPGFTVVAVLALALGIGANTAIFSVVNAVLLKPLPYQEPEKLVQIWMNFTGIGIPNDRNWVSPPEFVDLKTLNSSFSHLAAFSGDSFNLSTGGQPERVEGAAVSASFFDMLGIQARAGRAFQLGEDQPGRDDVVLLSDALWLRRFGGQASAVGQKINLNGRPHLVIGVLPPGFRFPDESELWVPLAFRPEQLAPNYRGSHGWEVLARIKPGLSLEQARADMRSVSRKIIEQNRNYPYQKFRFAVILSPLLEETVGDVRSALWILTGAVGFVLLIACANVANLLLARATARERELAVRTAIGASRERIVRQLLTESAVLSIFGALAGLVLASWGLRALAGLGSSVLPRAADAGIDIRVLAFTLFMALATAIVFGLLPALQASRGVTHESLKDGGRGSTAGGSHNRLRRALVVAEMALSLVLLAGAGLLVRSLLRVLNVDPGFRSDKVLTVRLALPEAKYPKPEQVRSFYRELLDRIERLPGVEAAGAVSRLPLSGGGGSGTTTLDTNAVPPDRRSPEADWRPITPGYFRAMGISLVRGRFFDARDNESAAPVAIIDESMANTYFPNDDPVGKRLHRGGAQSTSPWMTIVGVVRHVRYRTLEAPSRVTLYWPEAQNPARYMSLAIRTALDPGAMASTVQRTVLDLDPDQPIYSVRTMEQLVSESLARRRFSTLLLALFAGLALLLAAVGIYGVFSYLVTQRSHEIGIRMALGAGRWEVLRLVLAQSLSLTVAGIAFGLVGAWAVTRSLATLLFDVTATDPYTLGGVVAILAGVAMFASWVPARRATRLDPIHVLRNE